VAETTHSVPHKERIGSKNPFSNLPPGATDDGNLLRQQTIGPSSLASVLATFFGRLLWPTFLEHFFGQRFWNISLANFFVPLGFWSKEWVVLRATCFTFFFHSRLAHSRLAA